MRKKIAFSHFHRRYHEHEVQEDVPDCIDDEEVKCVDETQGYTTEQKCSRWPIRRCSLAKQTVKKFTPETTCEKIPFELCGPSSCPVEAGPEQCQDKEETVREGGEKGLFRFVAVVQIELGTYDLNVFISSSSRRFPKKFVTWSPSGSANMLRSWFPS